jgi:hypothetical protein
VLPLRFGAVMTDADAVAGELLRDHHDEFRRTLDDLEGHAQYILKGRYDQDRFLRDLLEQNPQASRLREDIKGKPEEAARDSRMALGELIANAVEAKRQADTATVAAAAESVARAVNVREPTHEWDAFTVAMLVDVARQDDVEALAADIEHQGGQRVEVRLLGPMAAYDFVVTAQPGG